MNKNETSEEEKGLISGFQLEMKGRQGGSDKSGAEQSNTLKPRDGFCSRETPRPSVDGDGRRISPGDNTSIYRYHTSV